MMLPTPEDRQLYPRMFIFIMRDEDERKLEKMLDELDIPIFYQCRGQGTATSEILDLFGLTGTTRILTAGILPKFYIKELFSRAEQELPLRQRGGGIALTISVTGMQSFVFQVLNEETRKAVAEQLEERVASDMAEMQASGRYSMIWVSVESGYSDDVVDAAKSAGARGGTIVHGRRRNSERVSQKMGISIQDGQEFVLIIVAREKKGAVMSAIGEACGLKTPAHGLVVSLPVDEVLGLGE
ncbi:transcriptional regulator [uncultured Pseudoflavonifractor sp.]|uniref:transcriptional regulator n=1 Tax=uncultured Pseudoflavonifractor sp. TaxID=1221379 RepID=UPI00260127E2|nr:transcriptional regulator [uncultured Pseudoflavonifractor sp.]